MAEIRAPDWERGDPRSVRYHCENCDTPIEEHHKTAMLPCNRGYVLADAAWAPVCVFAFGNAVNTTSRRKPISAHVSAVVKLTHVPFEI